MSGIVEALRDEAKRDDHRGAGRVLRLAADEIESLREQLATAQAAYLQFTQASDAKLAKATAALEQIAIVCTDNMDRDKNHRMALDFVRQVANDAMDSK